MSTNSNPDLSAGSWHEYATPGGFDDQPKIEATQFNLIVGANNSTVGEHYYVYDLSQIQNGQSNPSMQTVSDSVVAQPDATVNYSQSANGYFVGVTPSASITLSVISGRPTSGNVSVSVQTISSQTIAQPSEPAIPGGTLGGGAMDRRVIGAAYEVQTSNNHPVIDFSGNNECSGQSEVCTYDIKLDLTSTPAHIVKNLQLTPPTGASFVYGSVTMDARGNAILAYSRTDTNNTASANVIADNDAGNVLFNTQIQANAAGSTACGQNQTPPCSERWGDYFGAARDPSNTNNTWVSSAYQLLNTPFSGSGAVDWGTAFAEANSSGVILK
jgi:hypothetical protein